MRKKIFLQVEIPFVNATGHCYNNKNIVEYFQKSNDQCAKYFRFIHIDIPRGFMYCKTKLFHAID